MIELLTVSVILGGLRATALPESDGLGSDGRVAILKAAKGAMVAAAALAPGRWLIDSSAATVTMEGVGNSSTNGYPAVGTVAEGKKFAILAGPGGSDATIGTGKGELQVTPRGVAGFSAARCLDSDQPPSAAGAAPRFTEAASTYICN